MMLEARNTSTRRGVIGTSLPVLGLRPMRGVLVQSMIPRPSDGCRTTRTRRASPAPPATGSARSRRAPARPDPATRSSVTRSWRPPRPPDPPASTSYHPWPCRLPRPLAHVHASPHLGAGQSPSRSNRLNSNGEIDAAQDDSDRRAPSRMAFTPSWRAPPAAWRTCRRRSNCTNRRSQHSSACAPPPSPPSARRSHPRGRAFRPWARSLRRP